MNSRITEDVVYAWNQLAKDLLKNGAIPQFCTTRDLERLANAKYCDKCGAVYEIENSVTGDCPCCAELLETIEDLEGDLERSSEQCDELEEQIEKLEEQIKTLTKKEN